jgi:hypothetical protein
MIVLSVLVPGGTNSHTMHWHYTVHRFTRTGCRQSRTCAPSDCSWITGKPEVIHPGSTLSGRYGVFRKLPADPKKKAVKADPNGLGCDGKASTPACACGR